MEAISYWKGIKRLSALITSYGKHKTRPIILDSKMMMSGDSTRVDDSIKRSHGVVLIHSFTWLWSFFAIDFHS